MKVLITDREAWLKRVQSNIDHIQKKRDEAVAAIEASRAERKKTAWGRFWYTEDRWSMFFAKNKYGEQMDTLKSMRTALISTETSDIYFDEEEIAAAR